jgi:hypothetical protein
MGNRQATSKWVNPFDWPWRTCCQCSDAIVKVDEKAHLVGETSGWYAAIRS